MLARFGVFIIGFVLNSSLWADTADTRSTLESAQSTAPSSSPKNSSNQSLAEFAKELLIKNMPPVYEKRENWGHQTQVTSGYQWVRHPGGWYLDPTTRKVNDGLWRMYKVRLEDPERTLHLRFTQPRPTDDGGTKFEALLTGKLDIEARQEQWRLGIKGLNFHVAGEATVEVRLGIVMRVQAGTGEHLGTIEVHPEVTKVHLRLVDLDLNRVDFIRGDAARELGNAVEDILAGELHKQEPKVVAKINSEIKKNEDKLRFSLSSLGSLPASLLGSQP